MTSKPLAIDLYCGLGGWTEALLAEGWDVIGFDIERHDYGTGGYPGQLVLQDVCTLHGAQFRDADLIVASPPCQEFSYRAMPWKRAKALPPPYLGINLFCQCWRIQHEAEEATGHACPACDGLGPRHHGHVCQRCNGTAWITRKIPLIVENVRGAQEWVGNAAANNGSFYLWGDAPRAINYMHSPRPKGFKRNWMDAAMHKLRGSQGSEQRLAWSAQIAKIPQPLAQHIAKVFKPALQEQIA